MEDEDALRAAVAKSLRMRGFSVLEAGDGTAAVKQLHSHGSRIALVLLDVSLPGTPSHEVFDEARALGSGVKVIVTSAYGQDKVAGSFPGVQLEYFIRKPYRLGELVELVSTVLSGEHVHATMEMRGRGHARMVALIACSPFTAAMGAPDGAATRECAPCHRAIYEGYSQTPMAQSSGRVGSGLIRESFDNAIFDHAPSGFRYRVVRNDGHYFVEFGKPDGTLRGSKALPYYVGSGATARSYLLEADGFLFCAPVAGATARAKSGILRPSTKPTPIRISRASVAPGCLTCHASFLTLARGTQNRYGTPPFGQDVDSMRTMPWSRRSAHPENAGFCGGAAIPGGAIVNPAKLAPDLRDSVCAQCHLAGEVRVMRPGHDWQSFQAGQRLSDSMTVFVRANASAGMKVTSHVENLAQSGCKRGSGDRLWCGTCHDPHTVPKASERVAWFRQKCLTCHDTAACKETKAIRAARHDDCTSCHMPKSQVADAQHVVYTDHSIPRRPRGSVAPTAPPADLVVFGGARAQPRDAALAYGILASRTQTAADRARAVTAPLNRRSVTIPRTWR